MPPEIDPQIGRTLVVSGSTKLIVSEDLSANLIFCDDRVDGVEDAYTTSTGPAAAAAVVTDDCSKEQVIVRSAVIVRHRVFAASSSHGHRYSSVLR